MRNLLSRLRIVTPAQVRTVGDMPAVSPRRCYEDAVCALNSLQSNEATLQKTVQHPTKEDVRARRLLEHLQFVGLKMADIDNLKIIHVAGTKGKGSTCAFAESILRHHGFKTGLYTSPHLVAVRERIRINGRPLSEESFAKYFWDVYHSIKAEEGEHMPAYFHFLTVMAFKVFVKEKEVSLRRLRAVVALTPSVTWTWGPAPEDPGTCPKCPAPAAEADVYRLLWTCRGARTARDSALRVVGLRSDKPGNFNRWVHEDHYCRSLLNFLHETGLHAYL